MTKDTEQHNPVAREIRRQATGAVTRRFYHALVGYEPVRELPSSFQHMLDRLDLAEAQERGQDGRRRQE